MLNVLDLQSSSPGFESHSGHLLDLFSVVLSSHPHHACKKPTGCLLPVGVYNPVMFYLGFLCLVI